MPCLAEPRAGKGLLKPEFLSSAICCFTNVGVMRHAGACGQPFEVGQHAKPAEGAILAVRWIEVQLHTAVLGRACSRMASRRCTDHPRG